MTPAGVQIGVAASAIWTDPTMKQYHVLNDRMNSLMQDEGEEATPSMAP